jgi:adenine-specific DNA-methyltransferase
MEIMINKNSGDIILDFFAGSGTTAHAVMDLNAEDGGNRKYILVQLDEEVDEKSEAGKAGYKNIAEISRERIRRAGEKILEDKKDELRKRKEKLDIGFRSFKVSNSNYREWEAGDFDMFEEKLLEQAELFTDKPLVDNYKKINVVFETVVKEGFALSSKISQENDGKFWKIEDGERKMIINFSDKVKFEDVEKLKLDENDVFVCFDSALTDNDKINITKSINLKVV